MKALKPFVSAGFSDWTSLIKTKCSNLSSIVSTCPNIIVADVVIFNLCASLIMSNQTLPDHLPVLIILLTLSLRISAPAPGRLSIPDSFNDDNASV